MAHDPDTELVARAGAGDREAASLLVERHSARVLRLAWRMLGTREAAEDVTQETFLRLWRHAADWTPGAAKFETWLCRVATNLCYDRLRRKRETDAEVPERADETPNAAEALASRQSADAVKAAVDDLPERQRIAVTLCHFEELSNADAAEAMGVSVEALESLLARGRRGLKERLAPMREALRG